MSEISTVTVMFFLEIVTLLLLIFSYCCHKTTGSLLAERLGLNLSSFSFWGGLINIIMANFLPVLIACFIGLIGIRWDEDVPTAVILTNIGTIFFLHCWILFPMIMYCIMWKNRATMGTKKLKAMTGRDASKVSWRPDWKKIEDAKNLALEKAEKKVSDMKR